MKKSPWVVIAVAWIVLALVACSSDSTPAADASADAGPDDGANPDGPQKMEVTIERLGAPVDAVYDEHGILHLSCKTDADCMAALGYFHAYNRFFLMDFIRRLVRGRLGELVIAGDLVLESDYAMRHLMTSAKGQPLEELALESTSAETVALLQRYADGVNTYIADVKARRNNAALPSEYRFPLLAKDVLGEWTPADTMAVALYLLNDLGNSVEGELAYAEVAAALAPDLAADLLLVQPAFPTFTTVEAGAQKVAYELPERLDASRFVAARGAIQRARARIRHVLRQSGAPGGGSNNWIVSPGRTHNNKALLANDPHLSITNPAVFFPVEIDSKSNGDGTLHVAGVTIAGIPMVLMGRNETLAWGSTTANWDGLELYLEKLDASGSSVTFNGKQVPLTSKKFTFANALGEPVEKTFQYVPHHGPLLSVDGDQGISVRWTPAEGFPDGDALMALMRASSVAEVPAALAKATSLDQNYVVIDTKGEIGWYPYSDVPSRPWASPTLPPWLPVPGDGTAEWNGFIDHADLPQATNPPAGLLATANQAMTDASSDNDPTNDGDPAKIAYQAFNRAFGARMTRIIDLLEAKGNEHTPETMSEIQQDTYSLIGEKIAPELIAATSGATLTAPAQKVVDALSSWKYTCPTGLASADPEGAADSDAARVSESIGCMAFHTTLFQLVREAFGDEAAKGEVAIPTRAVLNVLVMSATKPAALKSDFWDRIDTSGVETKAEIMRAAIDAAATTLTDWQPDSSQWQWGRLHTLSKRSPFDTFGLDIFNEGNYANDGALCTVDVASPYGVFEGRLDPLDEQMDLTQRAGAAMRIVVEADASGMSMRFQLPGGTSLDRENPQRYNQLFDRYLEHQWVEFYFGPGAVKNPEQTLQVTAAP